MPPDVVTVTSTVPVPLGTVALIVVSLLTVKLARWPPKRTLLAPVKLVPVMLTEYELYPKTGSSR